MGMTGSVLTTITAADLRELGLESALLRKQFMSEVRKLRIQREKVENGKPLRDPSAAYVSEEQFRAFASDLYQRIDEQSAQLNEKMDQLIELFSSSERVEQGSRRGASGGCTDCTSFRLSEQYLGSRVWKSYWEEW
eukprot:TRINITY_DN2159_c0_g2_i1.p1 TRINITY_DN2159_c0_g2~~TRINITY_DN2159_c0_g2_i1.p1  ORF type:complete len:148 (+),score=23.00 TRINITY_DN2159_c0_g2_i1:39-446(+)